ncbi:Uncharacterized protein Adt_21059 [Abeliophyllum distichum]|uniref:Uncharacterized protein n=1 Tax=Abeliophyllum distichum TaxID=126358 RepID=A0ABD1SYE4_9LAMI
MFTPEFIDRYYKLMHHNIYPLPTEFDMGDVAKFLYGRDDAWPLSIRDFENNKLNDSLLILNLFVSHNIDPSGHRMTFSDAKAWFFLHLAHEKKIYLESHIYTLICNLGCKCDKHYTAIFPGLIGSIFATAGVHITFDEISVKPNA